MTFNLSTSNEWPFFASVKDVSGDFFTNTKPVMEHPVDALAWTTSAWLATLKSICSFGLGGCGFFVVFFRRFTFRQWNVSVASSPHAHHALPKIYDRAHGPISVIRRVIRVPPVGD